MRTVLVRAGNLKIGDIVEGQRIKAVHTYKRRCRRKGQSHPLAHTGVLVIAPNPNGNALDAIDYVGDEKVKVKRPIYNMEHRRKPSTTPTPTECPFRVGERVRSRINGNDYIVTVVKSPTKVSIKTDNDYMVRFENVAVHILESRE